MLLDRPAAALRGSRVHGQSAVIVVQQESLRERPRVHKLATVLSRLGVPVEIWKFGDVERDMELGIPTRNLVSNTWRAKPAALRYLVWMLLVFLNWWRFGRRSSFFAIGFDSAFPLSFLPGAGRWLVFDNLDNISMNYKWPAWLASVFGKLEFWTAWRAKLHVVPSRARWRGDEANLRIVTNTPSREALGQARELARLQNYAKQPPLTVYVNGWMSQTRGLRTLIAAIEILRVRNVRLRVLVAGRIASEDCKELIGLDCTEYLGLLTNAEALAVYFRSHIAFTYYDPAFAINRVAESQKWTDCWATETPFISNIEIETLKPYLDCNACFALPYSDAEGLARLLANLALKPELLADCAQRLRGMQFRFWDDEMEQIACDWLSIRQPQQGLRA